MIIEAPFKIIYTSNTKICKINTNWNYDEFITIITNQIKKEYNLNYDLEIIYFEDKEDGPALIKSNQILDKTKLLAFYLRKTDINYCGICFITINQLRNINGCCHSICLNCYNSCLYNNILSCPFCRIGRLIS